MSRLSRFEGNADRAQELVGMGEAISRMTNESIDPTDLYRSALVQAVAALDLYVHGTVLDCGVQVIGGLRATTVRSTFGLHLAAVGDILRAETPAEVELRAITHVGERLSRETFQRPDSIAEAFAMVGIPRIWATAFGSRAQATKEALNAVVSRRNQIVHACDLDMSDPELLQKLTAQEALDAIDVVRDVVLGIDAAC
jgi:hypothetical protein